MRLLKSNMTCVVNLETLGSFGGQKKKKLQETVSLSQANPARDWSGSISRLILYQLTLELAMRGG